MRMNANPSQEPAHPNADFSIGSYLKTGLRKMLMSSSSVGWALAHRSSSRPSGWWAKAHPTRLRGNDDQGHQLSAVRADALSIWFDGELVAADSPRAPLTTHALHYGSGVFEGIRSYATTDGGAAVFRLPEHLERMRKGTDMLGIGFDIAQATDATLQVLRANGHRDAYIRPLAWCGTGSIGLDVAPLSQHLMIATFPTGVHLAGSEVKLGVSSWRRNPATSLPPLKLCGAYVNSILAKREAKARGFDEALFVDAHGFVVECTGANVFMVKDNRIVAVEHADALPGITRDTLIALTDATSRAVTLDELRDADEVFVCGTAAEVTAIDTLDERRFAGNAVSRELAALYQRIVRGEDARYRAWLTHV